MTREEAIRIIEANCSCTDSTLMEACAMFIPELRESYDERIRKNIVATIEQCPDDFLSPKNRNRMLAYLEKLKEQKPQEPQVFCEAKAYDLGYKQGKEDAKKELKPAWSEEDKRILKGIIGKIDHDQTYGVSKDEMLNFLEDLCPSWKPSKQQMDALHEAVIRSCSHHYGVELLSLEIDLLNLK